MLQAKLHSQEEDFRLQNSTLMAEFSKLCSQLEKLELENRQLKEGGTGAAGPHVDGELLRLQAENTALQKNMAALQERYGKEAVRPSAVSEGQGDPPGDVLPSPLTPMPLAEVELKWEMEREEKKLLWEQLQGLEVNLGLSGLGCWEPADALPPACGPMEMSVTSPSHGLKGGGTGKIRGLLPPSLLITTPSLISPPYHPQSSKQAETSRLQEELAKVGFAAAWLSPDTRGALCLLRASI